jgi:hypothetical protein
MTPPKSCQELISATSELRQVLARGHSKDTIGSALARCEDAWKRCSAANLECSRTSGPPEHLQAFADALNAANEIMHRASGRLNFAMR